MGIWPSDASVERDVAQSGRNPDELALHSLRIGGAAVLAARADTPERVIQREGRWKSDAYKVYTRNNVEDAGQVSRTLAVAGKGPETARPRYYVVDFVAVSGDLVFGGVSTVSYRGCESVVLDYMGFGWVSVRIWLVVNGGRDGIQSKRPPLEYRKGWVR